MKPRLHILHTQRQNHIPLVDSPSVRERFGVTVGEAMLGHADLVWTQAYTNVRILQRMWDWGGPYIMQVGGDIWGEMGENSSRVGRILEGMRKAKAVVCVSEFLADLYRSRFGKGNFIALPGGLWGTDHCEKGVNPKRFTPKNDWNAKGKIRLVMSINITSREKWRGVPYFLQSIGASERYRIRYKMKITCSGRKKNHASIVKDWMKRYPFFKYKWLGSEWPNLLRNCDIFVHPSFFDGWPRAVAEAMCVGLPVVAYDVAGVSAVSKDIFLCDPKEPEQMISILSDLMEDSFFREKVGRMRREEALKKTEKHRGDYVKILTQVLEES